MKDIFEPLSNDELDWLDRFIICRFNEDDLPYPAQVKIVKAL